MTLLDPYFGRPEIQPFVKSGERPQIQKRETDKI